MAITKEQRIEINRRLPRGSQSVIARQIGLTRAAVNGWFRGNAESKRIETAVIEFFEAVVKYEEDINRRLSRLLTK